MTMGSSPVFPTIIYNFSLSYVINLININKAHKVLFFDLFFTKKTFIYIKLLHRLNYIFNYKLLKKNSTPFIRIYVYYWNNNPVGYQFKLISKPSHSFFVSLKSLTLLSKRTGSSIFLISSSQGLLTHYEAIQKKTGGLLLGFFTL